jgi:prepilin-type processing-associated H-X9-DG protein
VVIAVIAILASLLLPALGKAKEKGRQIACMNNVKNMFFAHFSYADDRNGYVCAGLEFSGGSYWCQRLEREEYIKGNFFDCPSSDNGTLVWMPKEMINRTVEYTRNSELDYLKLSKINSPSRTLLIGEKVPLQPVVFREATYQIRVNCKTHNNTGNLAFTDGHTENAPRLDDDLIVEP